MRELRQRDKQGLWERMERGKMPLLTQGGITKGDSVSREGQAGGPASRLALVFDVPLLDPEPPGRGGLWVEMVVLLKLA